MTDREKIVRTYLEGKLYPKSTWPQEEQDMFDFLVEIDNLRTKNDELEQKYRETLFFGHGHYHLYGDDGEMQCSECLTRYGIGDYKRVSLDKLEEMALFSKLESNSK